MSVPSGPRRRRVLIVYALLVLALSLFGGLGRYEFLLVALVSAALTYGVLRVRSRSTDRRST